MRASPGIVPKAELWIPSLPDSETTADRISKRDLGRWTERGPARIVDHGEHDCAQRGTNILNAASDRATREPDTVCGKSLLLTEVRHAKPKLTRDDMSQQTRRNHASSQQRLRQRCRDDSDRLSLGGFGLVLRSRRDDAHGARTLKARSLLPAAVRAS